jgi:hypothetical protein
LDVTCLACAQAPQPLHGGTWMRPLFILQLLPECVLGAKIRLNFRSVAEEVRDRPVHLFEAQGRKIPLNFLCRLALLKRDYDGIE